MNIKPLTIFTAFSLTILSFGQVNAQTTSNKSVNDYSFDLYRELKTENKNLFVSPLSTYYPLLMVFEGSKNATADEFKKVLHLENSQTNASLNDLIGRSESSLGISNAIWFDKSLRIKAGFRENLTKKYLSDFKQTEFANTQEALSAINQWTDEKTNHRINKIVDASMIDPNTKILITNAIYFKGAWLNKFDKKKSNSDLFFAIDENVYSVNFLHISEQLLYFENDKLQFISKPYQDSVMSFCILLPKNQFGIEAIEKKMNAGFLDSILNNAWVNKTIVAIPKIKLESSCMLSEALGNIGLKNAFSAKANFSGIAKKNNLMLGQVIHKASIEMDEEKTVAAATTATIYTVGAMKLSSSKTFRADIPFVFFIIDNRTKTIVFMGRYVKPDDGKKMDNVDKTKLRTLMQTSVEEILQGRTPPVNK